MSLAWSTTPDGGLLLSKKGRPVARLQPDRGENSDREETNECSYVAVRNDGGNSAAFSTMHEGKAFLEHWAMGESYETSRSAGLEGQERYADRNRERGKSDGRDR
jgi:hypothetical protein